MPGAGRDVDENQVLGNEEQVAMEEGRSTDEEHNAHEDRTESKSQRKRSLSTEDDTALQPRDAQKVKTSAKKPKDDGIICELSKNRFVSVQDFKGRLLISIREYYEKNGEMFPGSKGLSLTVEQWEALKDGISDVDAALTRLSNS